MRAYEAGFIRGLNAPVDRDWFVGLLQSIGGPLRCIEVAGMLVGGRLRVLRNGGSA